MATKMKRMACVIGDEEVEERCICGVCGKSHVITWALWDYMEQIEEGPAVGKYDGWDDVWELICDECIGKAENIFGEDFILSLLKAGELEMADFLAATALMIS